MKTRLIAVNPMALAALVDMAMHYRTEPVTDPDAFGRTGNVRDSTVAAGMRDIILAPGDTTDRAEACRQFRGRDPEVNALLRVRGFATGEAASGMND